MAIRWKCSNCSKKLSISARKAGCEIRCPACNEPITVPAEAETPPAEVQPSEPAWFASDAMVPPPAKEPAAFDFGTLAKSDPAVCVEPAVSVARPAVPATTPAAVKLSLGRMTGRQLLAVGGGAALLLLVATGLGLAVLSAPIAGQPAAEPVAAAALVESPPVPTAADKPAVVVPPATLAAPAPEPVVATAPKETAPAVVKAAEPPAPAKQVQSAVADDEPVGPEPRRPRRNGVLTTEDLRDQLREVPELDFYPHIDKLRQNAYAKGAAPVKGVPGGFGGAAAKGGAAGIRAGGLFGGIGGGANGAAGQADRMLQPLTTSPPDFAANVNNVVLKEARAAGLPLRTDVGCRADANVAKEMDTVSTTMRSILVTGQPGGGPRARIAIKGAPPAPKLALSERHEQVKEWCTKNNVEKYPGGLATLSQMLQVEEDSIRLVLVSQLAKVDTRESSNLLARRALFDLSGEVRLAAINALKKRRPESYRGVLLAGMRYPWAPAADHAAEALIELKDQGAVPSLIGLLDKTDPTLPELDVSNTYKVRELVKINHMRNCYLCHASSTSAKDLVRGLTPKAGGQVMALYPTKCACGDFVQAQITYLRQDFSVIQHVGDSNPWPEEQRYDYVVRTRKATAEEMQAAKDRTDSSYPQRESVLKALRGLTGRDAGSTAEEWRKVQGAPKEEPLPAAPPSTPLPGGIIDHVL